MELNLREAYMRRDHITEDEADKCIEELVDEFLDGANPEEVLEDAGFEADYVIDLLNACEGRN